MQPESTVFSSAGMRDRDKRVESRHRQETGSLERKIENLRRSNDDTRKQLFDVVQRSDRLAQSLGFQSVFEAQETLDLMDEPCSYKDSLQRMQDLEAQLRATRTEAEEAREQVATFQSLQRDNKLLQKQNKDLTDKLDDLQANYRRVGEIYKRDYKKARELFRWADEQEAKHLMNTNVAGPADKDKERLVQEHQAYTVAGLRRIVPNPAEYGREFDATWATPQATWKRSVVTPGTAVTLVNTVRRPLPAAFPLISPTFNPKNVVDPIPNSSDTEQDTQPPMGGSVQRAAPAALSSPTFFSGPVKSHIPNSSDTEEDTQPPMGPKPEVVFKLPPLPPHIANSSDTEDDTPPPSQTRAANAPAKRCVPNSSDTEDDPPLSQPLSSSNASNAQTRPPAVPAHFERPTKIRRLGVVQDDSSTPRRSDENTRPMPKTEPTKASSSRLPLPAKAPQTVAPSKGKGRYARHSESGPGSSLAINAVFAIDPDKNSGLDFQYDEVVRSRDARRNMDAGDCECCHDYYEAVGPLPARAQGPLWRSPSKTLKRRECSHRNDGRGDDEGTPTRQRQMEIESRKKGISRHRHTWTRAKTPPDYWNIGFPSTQEAAQINQKAEQMHRNKVRDIEREVNNGVGKYKRR
ncbi:hypothetical protein FA15DRAFT_687731 [Coprinopsis marcescibilis]|uniref:DNA endonuclease activator Ctp1 C-terminal domain-containing protein n=1 Tax=Coprinopsis marcescibilis TaxID=230819 RepID=A0A5C3KTG5_COPMA|nr:hypothetical protein FA15DRAFT_687731 [Coprinopsis marcescibilis]